MHYSSTMKSSLQELVLGIPISSAAYKVDRSPIKGYLPDPANQCNIPSLKGACLKSKHNIKPPSSLFQSISINNSFLVIRQSFIAGSADTVLNRKNKSVKNVASFALGVREHGKYCCDHQAPQLCSHFLNDEMYSSIYL